MNKKYIAEQEALVDDWNAKYPIGTEVQVTLDLGEILDTKTRSIAWCLGHGAAIIKVEGISGGYLLERVIAK